tara:strand:+ start:11822 stop:12481 length:660 start_codon:yes stop_codon:yes gene_type:complete
MANIKFTFDNSVNVSAQEGDTLYFSNVSDNQGSGNDIHQLGTILDISRTPFIHSIAGQLSAASSTHSLITFYTVNQGVDGGMDIECVVSGSTAATPVLAQNVLSPGTTIGNISHTGNATSCQTSVPALDTVGGQNYKFKLTTPGTTTLEVSMSSSSVASHLSETCSPCLSPNSFLLFSKDNDANLSSMLGYFAKVKFKNNSSGPIELFTVGSEVTQSSK